MKITQQHHARLQKHIYDWMREMFAQELQDLNAPEYLSDFISMHAATAAYSAVICALETAKKCESTPT